MLHTSKSLIENFSAQFTKCLSTLCEGAIYTLTPMFSLEQLAGIVFISMLKTLLRGELTCVDHKLKNIQRFSSPRRTFLLQTHSSGLCHLFTFRSDIHCEGHFIKVPCQVLTFTVSKTNVPMYFLQRKNLCLAILEEPKIVA